MIVWLHGFQIYPLLPLESIIVDECHFREDMEAPKSIVGYFPFYPIYEGRVTIIWSKGKYEEGVKNFHHPTVLDSNEHQCL